MNRREYFRDKYEKWWPVSAEWEKKIMGMLEKHLGPIVPYGMGSLSTERLTGSARDNGFEPADPDFYSPIYDRFFEVTGPIPLYMHPRDDLWVNPDKVENARRKFALGRPTWLIHVLDRKGVREQILSLVGDILSPEVRKLISSYCLTESARCRLGKLCSNVKKGIVDKTQLARSVNYFYKNDKLVSSNGNEESIIRCFLMDQDFARTFSNNTVTLGPETFIKVPAYWQGIVSFQEMIERVTTEKTIRGRNI